MSYWSNEFALVLLATCRDILPIAAIIIGFQLLVIRKPLAHPKKTLIGFLYVLLGIAFFLEGLEMALFPLGKLMASQLTTPEFLGINSTRTERSLASLFLGLCFCRQHWFCDGLGRTVPTRCCP